MPRASSYAANVDGLFDLITYLVGFWFLLTLGFFFYVLFRFRRKPGQKAQYMTGETHKEKLAIEIPHYAILVCDLAILIFTFKVWHQIKIDMPPADEKVRVISQQWAWTFQHAGEDGLLDTEDDIVSVNELHLKNNTQYTFHLVARDVMHSFSIPVFRFKQDSVPGRIIDGHFKPIMTGSWDIQCAEMCGFGHGLMPAKLFVASEEDHNAWVAANSPKDKAANQAMLNRILVGLTEKKIEEDHNNG